MTECPGSLEWRMAQADYAYNRRQTRRAEQACVGPTRDTNIASRYVDIATQIARRGGPHGSSLGKTRWVVERTFAWLHNFGRPRIRFDRLAAIHKAFVKIATASFAGDYFKIHAVRAS